MENGELRMENGEWRIKNEELMKGFLMILSLLMTFAVQAQVKMSDVVRQMPDTLYPYLNENMRLDMLDFIDSGMTAEVTNNLGGKTVLNTLTPHFSSFQLNEASTMQMRLLDVSEPTDSISQIICMIRTWGKDFKESQVSFYTTDWKALPARQYFSAPAYPCTMTMDEHTPTLTITPVSTLDYPANEEQQTAISDEQQAAVDKLTTLKWNGEIFK